MKKSNYFIGVVCTFCLFFSFACSTLPEVERENDFQISANYYEKRRSVRKTVFAIRDMNNEKFLKAVKNQDYSTVKYFFQNEKYFSPKAYDNYGQTVLMWACWNDDYEMVKFLLKTEPTKCKKEKITAEHIKAHSYDKYKYNALFCAAFKGNDLIIQLLLDYGAVIDDSEKDSQGENILHKMAKSGKAGNIKAILDNTKYGINSYNREKWRNMFYGANESGYTPFHLAIVNKDSQMVKLFLDLEKELKRPNDKWIVNEPAKVGQQSVYPLYTAFKVLSPDIFQQLLEKEELDTNITFPDGNAEHSDNQIGDEFQLAKRGHLLFETQKKDTSTYKTFDNDVNVFSEMYRNREKWQEERTNGNSTKLIIKSDELNAFKAKLIEIIEYSTEDGINIGSSEEAIRKLKKLKRNLYGNLNGIGYSEGKDLLQLAVDNEKFTAQEKLDILKWLLKDGYRSLDSENDILYYCLHNANSRRKYLFDIAEYLIYNKGEYNDSYSFQRLGKEAYVEIMTNKYIRNLENAWDSRLKNLLETIAHEYSFDEEKVWQNISCAVTGKKEISHGKQEIPQYALEMFKFFSKQCDYEIRMDSTPLCSWFFEIGFDDGVDEILNNETFAKSLKINNMFDINKKRFIDLLNNSTEQDEQRKKKIDIWKEKYNKLFPNESKH